MRTWFYDADKSYEENFDKGPFGLFADGVVLDHRGAAQTTLLGQRLFLPFGIPAGPLINGKFVKAALDKGFDLAVYATVRTRARACAPWPNIVAVEVDGDLPAEPGGATLLTGRGYGRPAAVANSFHVPSCAPDFWQQDLADAVGHAQPGQVVIGSFQGSVTEDGNLKAYIGDFVTAAKLVAETGAKVLEANLSCPSPGSALLLCHDRELARRTIEEIKNETGDTPLVVKIPYFADREDLGALVATLAPLVQGISAVNTIQARIVDRSGAPAWPGEGRTTGGVGGAPIKWAGLEMTRRLTELRDHCGSSYAVIGVGGVCTRDDYQDYRAAGADAVMSASGAIWNPLLAQECAGAGINCGM